MTENKTKEPIEILMAAYNGERYIREQIDSIISQTNKNWTLVIRDDGSSDKTVDIIKEHERQYPGKIKLMTGGTPHLGVNMNFRQLLEQCKAKYVMLCDQDDIWLPDKIDLSIQKMTALEKTHSQNDPLLIFTDLKLVDENLSTIHKSFWRYRKISPANMTLNHLLIENVVTGCTIMMNDTLCALSRKIHPNACMHDWWIGLVAATFGHIDSVRIQTVLYRRHGTTETSPIKWNLRETMRKLLDSKDTIQKLLETRNKHQAQAAAFYETYKGLQLGQNNKIDIARAFSTLGKMNFIGRKIFLLRNRFCYDDIFRTVGNILIQ